MAHVVVIVGVLAFFGICALLVMACDRIIGPDEPELGTVAATEGSSPANERPRESETR